MFCLSTQWSRALAAAARTRFRDSPRPLNRPVRFPWSVVHVMEISITFVLSPSHVRAWVSMPERGRLATPAAASYSHACAHGGPTNCCHRTRLAVDRRCAVLLARLCVYL